ncbi:MAG: type II toxin-antitoxin system HicA family toxin [Ignavibacteriae bacterium]|nr:type II toxin-antitoxin system HicA family toxin [Ignavibacteriota bacterium]
MGKLATLKIKDFEFVFTKLNFILLRQKGSHRIYRHPDGRVIVLPVHKGKSIKEGLAHKIITKDLKISIQEFLKMLE